MTDANAPIYGEAECSKCFPKKIHLKRKRGDRSSQSLSGRQRYSRTSDATRQTRPREGIWFEVSSYGQSPGGYHWRGQ
jgi:hypothetical protein